MNFKMGSLETARNSFRLLFCLFNYYIPGIINFRMPECFFRTLTDWMSYLSDYHWIYVCAVTAINIPFCTWFTIEELSIVQSPSGNPHTLHCCIKPQSDCCYIGTFPLKITSKYKWMTRAIVKKYINIYMEIWVI